MWLLEMKIGWNMQIFEIITACMSSKWNNKTTLEVNLHLETFFKKTQKLVRMGKCHLVAFVL